MADGLHPRSHWVSVSVRFGYGRGLSQSLRPGVSQSKGQEQGLSHGLGQFRASFRLWV